MVSSLPRSPRRAAVTHQIIACMLLGGFSLQLFFAGLGIFGITTFLPHVILGTVTPCRCRTHLFDRSGHETVKTTPMLEAMTREATRYHERGTLQSN